MGRLGYDGLILTRDAAGDYQSSEADWVLSTQWASSFRNRRLRRVPLILQAICYNLSSVKCRKRHSTKIREKQFMSVTITEKAAKEVQRVMSEQKMREEAILRG